MTRHPSPVTLHPGLLALSSAVLLVLSFPNFNQPWCAWVALVPWLVLLQHTDRRGAFWWSYLVGLVFFLSSMSWLTHLAEFGGMMALVGWVALCAYLALYFGMFGWLVHRWGDTRRKTGDQRQETSDTSRVSRRMSQVGLWSQVSGLIGIPSAWVVLEYLRSHLLSGFGWNLLAYSQAHALAAIQIADLTGAWGVSYVLVTMNVAIAWMVSDQDTRTTRPSLLIAVGLALGTWLYGHHRLAQLTPPNTLRVAVVQGNVPQAEKWDETFQASILERYERLTRQAVAGNPQLIVWPETSVPGLLGLVEPLTTRVRQLARELRTPLLVGAPMGRLEGDLWRLTNSAVWLSSDGAIAMRYDKLHLVPFGEFIPGESLFPWLRNILPPIGDFVPGGDYTVFRLQSSDFSLQTSNLEPPAFSVLICFEDIFPDLARQCVQRGARLLLTITNDAWFGPTAAAYQHAQASTFRAVELRVPMIRAANTGWSGCIDATGRWLASVHSPTGQELFVEGLAVCEVGLGDADTLYRRWGDWVVWVCLSLVVGWMGSRVRVRSRAGRRRARLHG